MRKLPLLLVAVAAALVTAALPPLADRLCESLESRYPPKPAAGMPEADAILVLGGGILGANPPRVIPQLTLAGSRAWYGARLWKAGKAPLIFGLGGGRGIPESTAIAEFLTDLGVAPAAIVEEPASRTTIENALFARPLLARHHVRRALLVTSAIHMPRALAIFAAAGIDVIPAPADVEVVRDRDYGLRDWLPSVEALSRTSRSVKEYIGLLTWRIQLWAADSGAHAGAAGIGGVSDGRRPVAPSQDRPAAAPSR
jgi:uncharacterized SAM-binding protein YcdF (DUF218 family)